MTPQFPNSTIRPTSRNGASHASSLTCEAIAATDGERLMLFRRYRDEGAFAEVVDAHASMVWGVCWQVLRHRHDVEDAFQATFMILARKAGSIRANDSAAGWLYRVALRTALIVRHRRRRRSEQSLEEEPLTEGQQLAAVESSEQRFALLEELRELPDRYQQPLLLCYFEGLSRREAAEQLGCTVATVKGRLTRGRRMLRTRLVRRGVALSTAMSALGVQLAEANAAVNLAVVSKAANTASVFTHHAAASTYSAAASIAKEGILAMTISTASKPGLGLLAAGLVSLILATAVAEQRTEPISTTVRGGAIHLAQSARAAASEPAAEAVVVQATPSATETTRADSNDLNFASTDDTVVITTKEDGISADVVTVRTQTVAQNGAEAAAPTAHASDSVGPAPDNDAPSPDSIPSTTAATARVAATQVPPSADASQAPTQPGRPRAPMTPNAPRPASAPPQQAPPTPSTQVIVPRVPVRSMQPYSTLSSRKQLSLELDYWRLKADGLKRKADVLTTKSERLKQLEGTGAISASEELGAQEARTEAILLLAEVKLCESKAAGIEHQLEWLKKQPQPDPSPDGQAHAIPIHASPTTNYSSTAYPAAPPGYDESQTVVPRPPVVYQQSARRVQRASNEQRPFEVRRSNANGSTNPYIDLPANNPPAGTAAVPVVPDSPDPPPRPIPKEADEETLRRIFESLGELQWQNLNLRREIEELKANRRHLREDNTYPGSAAGTEQTVEATN